ncbi:ferredoxin [Candidatus Berkelbacteria bacterium CG10_big_fil_rev_8_21_14_0_10_41_12]|uniref:Ferredoxin n=1 Tax=Candidatus Berkelbacteria bacterium CG10_big_fil_rev_8_21_14_0_10_41_12 TaxID=1974513 RepID=A0A2M6WWV7_9BACT|nr:MAG: ferredoxin [Candidatus Berkelbacteria bacterium CG10_big_fil_rev_8_21_14_0_10_41_12]
MKAKVDKDKCISCGTCISLCPSCFRFDKDSKSEFVDSSCEDCDLREIASSCPAEAIEVEE